MNPKKLLIFFPPGARGDFLASILMNRSDKVLHPNLMRPQGMPRYKKMHGFERHLQPELKCSRMDFATTSSIRIRLTKLSDFLTVAWYWKNKNLAWSPEDQHKLDFLLDHEKRHSPLDNEFKHLVDFNELVSIQGVCNVYKRITSWDLKESAKTIIQSNLDLHQLVDEQNYHQYLQNIDLASIQEKYKLLHAN